MPRKIKFADTSEIDQYQEEADEIVQVIFDAIERPASKRERYFISNESCVSGFLSSDPRVKEMQYGYLKRHFKMEMRGYILELAKVIRKSRMT